jgi:glucose-6-phosphate dehydrogenase assembly protein OpcA
MLSPNLFPLFLRFLHTVFQMLYALQGWEAERMSWRPVIHLNLVRSVNRILDALENAPETEMASRVNQLRMRLSSLRRVQRDLETHLGLTGGGEMHAAADSEVIRRPTEACLHSQMGGAALGLAGQKIDHQGERSLQKMHSKSS